MQKTAKKTKGEIVVLSVGGSLICPDGPDTHFIDTFRSVMMRGVKKGQKFIIITGGGKLARIYQDCFTHLGGVSHADADWIGIDATRINARLIKSLFGKNAEDHIIQSPVEKFVFKKSIIVGGGWKPGFSSDLDAVLLAKRFKAKKMINLSNIDYVYTADPRTNPEAKKIEEIAWKEFRKIIPKKWTPGLSSPFDPIASKEAEKIKLEVAIINGKKLEELDNYLENKAFVGSLIK